MGRGDGQNCKFPVGGDSGCFPGFRVLDVDCALSRPLAELEAGREATWTGRDADAL